MQNDLKMYTKVCAECGREYLTEKKQKKLCPECASRRKKESNVRVAEQFRASRRNTGAVKPSKIPSHDVVPLDIFVRLVDRYNQRNRTRYTYGQAQQHLADGSIQKNEFYF